MGRPKFNWRKIVCQIFRPREGRERSKTIAPVTSVKDNIKSLRLSRSFSLLRNPSTPSSETRDDASSFMSPMPEELRTLPAVDDSDIFSPPDDQNRIDSVRVSFINCNGIIDTFPEPPPTFKSRTLPPRRLPAGRGCPFSGSPQPPNEDGESRYSPRSPTKLRSNRVHSRIHTPHLLSHRYRSLQHSTTPIPFGYISHPPAANGFMSNPDLRRPLQRPPPRMALAPSASLRLQLSPASSRPLSQSSLARSKSCTLLSQPPPPEACSVASYPRILPSRRFVSRDGTRPISPIPGPQTVVPLSPLSPSFPLNSFHVPGLEHRAMKSSSSSLTSHNGTFNISGSHVPIGTPRF